MSLCVYLIPLCSCPCSLYVVSLSLSVCLLCFLILSVPHPVCIMFSSASPASLVRLCSAVFPGCFLSALIPYSVYMSVSPSVILTISLILWLCVLAIQCFIVL